MPKHTGSREKNIWALMRQRCSNPKAANYVNYGARGIRVCDEWAKFAQFYADMGPAPSLDHTLDRIDNDGHYTPENCRWATPEEQQNNRRDNQRITAYGRTQTLAQWVRETKLTRDIIKHRIEVMEMTPEEAFASPKMSWVQRHVIQMNLDGSLVGVHPSLAAAGKASGVRRETIWATLKNGSGKSGGFFWVYVPSVT